MLRKTLQLVGIGFALSGTMASSCLAEPAAPQNAVANTAVQQTQYLADRETCRAGAESSPGVVAQQNPNEHNAAVIASYCGCMKEKNYTIPGCSASESASLTDLQPGGVKPQSKTSEAKQVAKADQAAKPVAPATTPETQSAAPAESKTAQSSSGEKLRSTAPEEPKKVIWAFDGMKGYVDKQAAQRGFQVYSQVCSACHSMNLIAYRDLSKIGFTEAEIKAIAAQKQVEQIDDDTGERVQKPGKPFDRFVPPFPNEAAARAANSGAYPPDLSLITKAREHGPDYIYSLMIGFGNPPAGEPVTANKYYNPFFAGHWLSMPPPLHDDAVSYQDGTKASIDQMARDVVIFLQWAAEPEMEQRHETGIKVLIFLLIMTIATYVAKKRVWKNIKH